MWIRLPRDTTKGNRMCSFPTPSTCVGVPPCWSYTAHRVGACMQHFIHQRASVCKQLVTPAARPVDCEYTVSTTACRLALQACKQPGQHGSPTECSTTSKGGQITAVYVWLASTPRHMSSLSAGPGLSPPKRAVCIHVLQIPNKQINKQTKKTPPQQQCLLTT